MTCSDIQSNVTWLGTDQSLFHRIRGDRSPGKQETMLGESQERF